MKKILCVVGFVVLAAQIPLWGFDTSPSSLQIVPEAIWAEATGGGTWVTELEIISLGDTAADVLVYFDYAGGSAGPFQVTTALAKFRCVTFTNILSVLDALDSSGFVYFGRVGALRVQTADSNSRIHAQAKTVNGNYGKTFPGVNVIAGNVAAHGYSMMIQGFVRNATYRTSAGIYNPSATYTFTVRLQIFDPNENQVGSTFDRILPPHGFLSFNPFVQAGITSGTYDSCWFFIQVVEEVIPLEGVISYASLANNYTNDTYALLPKKR